ncbi:MAG: DUF1203 domain-containing protein [Frankiales bacterium]|nr:DUF1203 domain-containing protein [Frankiales bacterium]
MTATRVQAIPGDVVDALRVQDDAGRTPRHTLDADGGTPLRCCLRLSRPGEELLLLSYAPLRRWAAATGADPGPYDEVGPVFVHRAPCDGYAGDGIPPELTGSPRMLRAYSADGSILRGVLADGRDLAATTAQLLSDPAVAFVHARAVDVGCFTFAIHRATSTPSVAA